jgi:tetratricopeptide (TPR) repeat protein
MNELKIQYKALIFKNCTLFLLLVFLVFPKLNAQSLADTSDTNILYDSSKVHYSIGDFNNAIQILNKILKIKSKELHDTNPKYFRVYNRLGYVYKIQGSFHKAINLYEKAIDHTIDEYPIAIIKGNIANIYSETGDYAKAISYLEESLLILQNSGHKDKYQRIITNYHNQGYAYLNSG